MLDTVRDLFTDHWPSSADTWLPDGQVPAPGHVLRLEGYAATLRRLVESASSAVGPGRSGSTQHAANGGAASSRRRSTASWARRTGTPPAPTTPVCITAADMAAFSAGYEPATTLDFGGVTVAKTGAWGQGPVLLQALAILDGFEPHEVDPSTGPGAHRVLETLKLALADRDAYYGDPEPGRRWGRPARRSCCRRRTPRVDVR